MNIEQFISFLDFENYDYFYHETNLSSAYNILSSGLLVDGNNILDVDNILFTTSFPLTRDFVEDKEEFEEFLQDESSPRNLREVSAMVILAAQKDLKQKIVKPYDTFYEGHYYEGLVEAEYVLGYFNLTNMYFMPNVNCIYYEDMLENRSR